MHVPVICHDYLNEWFFGGVNNVVAIITEF